MSSVRWLTLAVAVWLASVPPITAENTSTSLDKLAFLYTTPKTIAAFLKHEFTFERDWDLFGEAEHWQTPQEFLTKRKGDCEDYALLAQGLLVRNGIEAYVFSLYGEGYAHTVCVFVEEGRYNVINQDRVRYYRTKSLEALASAIYPAWTVGAISEQIGTEGRLVREITNPHPAAPLAFETEADF